MATIDILYDIQHDELKENVESGVKKISKKNNLNVNIDICGGDELLDKLKSNPNYDFVILHLGQNNVGAYRQADICRRLTNSILVGETSMAPYLNKHEVLEHFDECIGTIMNYLNLEELLSKYYFISS